MDMEHAVAVSWDDVMTELKGLRSDVHSIKLEMSQYRGFVRGVAWTVSALAGVIGFVWGFLFSKP